MPNTKSTIKLRNLKRKKHDSVKDADIETFSIKHGLAILRKQAKTAYKGWEIAEKDYEFKNNEISKK